MLLLLLLTLNERLKHAMTEANVSSADLARACGVSTASVSDWLSGESKSIKAANLLKAAKFLNVSPDWLATGQGPMRLNQHQVNEPAAVYAASNVVAITTPQSKVPLIDWVIAGTWCDVADPYPEGMAEEWLDCPMRHSARTYALKVRGSSMLNPGGDRSFKDGDLIFVDPDRQAEHSSLVICRLDDTKEATFKRLLIEGDIKMLEALNPSWPDRIMRINGNATICGVVIGKVESY